jgi:hypothetical protein
MTLTKFIYKKDSSSHPAANSKEKMENEEDQILHLKRLLVTLKQHYEKIVQQNRTQLQETELAHEALKQELLQTQQQKTLIQSLHEEELQALRDQQLALKELLKQSQDELQQVRPLVLSDSHPDLMASRQRMEQLERVIPYLRERTEEANLETAQLREELREQQKKANQFEQELMQEKQKAQDEINYLKELVAIHKQQDEGLETVVSQTSSHHLKQELEGIKRTIVQGAQESKAIETRYIDMLNEKIELEYQSKQLHMQLENQSANLASAHAQIHDIECQKQALEELVQQQQNRMNLSGEQEEELRKHIVRLEELVREKELMHDKYEQLKEEWEQISAHLDETLDLRLRAEKQLTHLENVVKEQEQNLQNCYQQIDQLSHSKQELEVQTEQLRTLLEESEARLKMAQQHLAKKVKESALLNEKLEEQQTYLFDLNQTVDVQRNQLSQFQASADLYQKQENQLREQLREALKNSEVQIEKWEQKYFQMADKWQESESRSRELKKFEEKHHQLQSLLSNLGSFMGGNTASLEELSLLPGSLEIPSLKVDQEKYDLFGMKQQNSEKHKTNLFS